MPTNPLDLLKINNYNYGDITDKKAAAEQNQTYFAYWDSLGGTGPEIIDQTSYAIKYLIDTEGNIYNPEPDVSSNRPQAIALYNLLNNFEIGKNATVKFLTNNPLYDTSPDSNVLTGTHEITHVGRFQLIASSETGYNINDYANRIDFTSPSSEGVLDMGMVLFSNGTGKSTNMIPFGFGTSRAVRFTSVSRNSHLLDEPTDYDTYLTSSITAQCQIGMKFNVTYRRADTTIPTTFKVDIDVSQPGPNYNAARGIFTFQGNESDINISLDTGLLDFQINTGIEVNVFIQGDEGSDLYLLDGYDNGDGTTVPQTVNWTVYQNPISFDQDIFGLTYVTASMDESHWQVYNSGSSFISNPTYLSIVGGTSLLKSSAPLCNVYLAADTTNIVAVVPTSSIASSYQTIGVNFKPQVGDYIRLEYNKNKVYKICEVFTDTDISSGGGSGDGTQRLYFRIFPEAPYSTQTNHFVLYRIVNDGSSIILDVKRDVPGGTYTGILQPEYVSQELIENYDKIIQNLTEREIIN